MFEFIVVVSFFLFVFLAIYSRSIYFVLVAKYSKKRFIATLNSLGSLFSSCLFIKTELLGEGESQNSDIIFECAQKNQTVATNSILGLIREMSGK